MELRENSTLFFAIAVILFLAASIVFRIYRGWRAPVGMASSLLKAVQKNTKLVETFNFNWRSKKFSTASWKRDKSKLDFLPPELMDTLANAFDIAEAFNEKIDAAKKHKTDNYMASIEVDKLRSPLAKSRQELAQWILSNIRNPEYQPKRRGIFG